MDSIPNNAPPVFRTGDQVELRKSHPCGSNRWVIYRIGADIGLRCTGCNRRIMVPRSELLKQMKRLVTISATSAEEE